MRTLPRRALAQTLSACGLQLQTCSWNPGADVGCPTVPVALVRWCLSIVPDGNLCRERKLGGLEEARESGRGRAVGSQAPSEAATSAPQPLCPVNPGD